MMLLDATLTQVTWFAATADCIVAKVVHEHVARVNIHTGPAMIYMYTCGYMVHVGAHVHH